MSEPAPLGATPLALLTDGARRDTWLLPQFTPGAETPTLDPGESVLMVIRDGCVTLEARDAATQPWRMIWSSPKTATVTLTDRRVVVGCRGYERTLPRPSAGLNAGPRQPRQAGPASLGKCLGVQFRHEWISHVVHARETDGWHQRFAGCPGVPKHRIGVVVWDRGRRWRLLFGAARGTGVDGEVAQILAQAVVRSRLRYPDLLDETELAATRECARNVRLDVRSGTTRQVHIPAARTIGYQPQRHAVRRLGVTPDVETGRAGSSGTQPHEGDRLVAPAATDPEHQA